MNENVNVCITPKGDKPVLHFSQFDNENVFTVTVLADDGESAAVLTGLDIEFRLRKTDSHVVTIAPESVADNVITFKTTEQMCACCGQNIATVTLMKDDMIVSTLDILVDIQRDILSGGLTSESDIRNLTTQIEQIVPEVVGDDYYNKQEVDDLLAEHTIDPSNYYNKSDVDDLLGDKADSDDVYTKSDVYNKNETDNLLSAKMDNIGYHGVVDDAAVISFTTDCNAPLAVIKGKIDPNPSGFSALNVTRTGVNLFDKTTAQKGGFNISGVFNPNASDTRYGSDYIKVLANTDYYISNGLQLASGRSGFWYDENKNAISQINFETSSLYYGVVHSPNNAVYVRISTNNDRIDSCQFEKGNQASTYEPYNGQTATVNFGQSVTIGGVIDLTNGKVTLTDDTVISVTPVTVSSIAGDNNILLDTGNLTEIAYFENAEDNLIKLIKACQI